MPGDYYFCYFCACFRGFARFVVVMAVMLMVMMVSVSFMVPVMLMRLLYFTLYQHINLLRPLYLFSVFYNTVTGKISRKGTGFFGLE